MALLGTYGGADDVRIYQNRILAEQAGALVPEDGKTIYPTPVVTEIPTITITDDTVAGEFILDISSPGVVKTDKVTSGVRVSWFTSVVGTVSTNNTKLVDIAVDAPTAISTKDFPDLVRPCVIYARIIHLYTNDSGVTTGFNTSTDGKQIPAAPVADPVADPVVRTASTRTTRKVTA
jgi:hypothetical protein